MNLYCTFDPKTDYTCLSHEQLRKIAQLYNRNHPEQEINVNLPMENLYDELMNRNPECQGKGDACLIERCYVRNNSIYDEVNQALLPIRPKKSNAWLSTEDIDQYLERLMKLHSDFIAFRPVPIDFAKPMVGCQYIERLEQKFCLHNLDLNRIYKQGIRKIGIVYNTDPSTKKGQHWIALFIDLNKREINYWDSYGQCPAPPEIVDFINVLKPQAPNVYKNKSAKFTVNCNTIRHQYGDTECGVYCLNFIQKSVDNVDFYQIISNVIDDERMNRMRDNFFRPNYAQEKCNIPLYDRIYGASRKRGTAKGRGKNKKSSKRKRRLNK